MKVSVSTTGVNTIWRSTQIMKDCEERKVNALRWGKEVDYISSAATLDWVQVNVSYHKGDLRVVVEHFQGCYKRHVILFMHRREQWIKESHFPCVAGGGQ